MVKFLPTVQSVDEIIESLDNPRKQNDARELVKLYEKVSKDKPIVWYPGIIGFGEYTYESEKGQKGRSPILAFAPRKQRTSLYISMDLEDRDNLISKLGKTKQGALWDKDKIEKNGIIYLAYPKMKNKLGHVPFIETIFYPI